MTTYTQKGSVTIDAFQWNGGTGIPTNLPYWTKNLALHNSSGDLHVPTSSGTLVAKSTDWVYRGPDGSVNVMTNAHFVKLYQ